MSFSQLLEIKFLCDINCFLFKLLVEILITYSSLVQHLLKTSAVDGLESDIVQSGYHCIVDLGEVGEVSQFLDHSSCSLSALHDLLDQVLLHSSLLDLHAHLQL